MSHNGSNRSLFMFRSGLNGLLFMFRDGLNCLLFTSHNELLLEPSALNPSERQSNMMIFCLFFQVMERCKRELLTAIRSNKEPRDEKTAFRAISGPVAPLCRSLVSSVAINRAIHS